MDPWADTSAAWSPQEAAHPKSPRPIPDVSETYAAGPVDPWAEPSSSSSIPVISARRKSSNSSQDYPRQARSGSASDFDPWGGNSAPVAPLSTAFDSGVSEERSTSLSEEKAPGWSGEEIEPENDIHLTPPHESNEDASTTPKEQGAETAGVVDDDDPWGSGAAARRIKLQQEAESAAQRMEILRIQEEAKGKQIDDAGNEVEVKPDETAASEASEGQEDSKAVGEAPITSGWRSLFSRTAAKAATTEETKAAKEEPKVDTIVAAKESSRSATALPAPRLWQAPAILGAHARSSSSGSRTESIKDANASTTAGTPPTKGPGWEVVTKKQQASGSGGLFQGFFGSNAATSSNEGDKVTVTAVPKQNKTSGINRFGRGMQPPPVVSAADEEDESFETEETGIEWEAGNAFDGKGNQLDLLSDDTDAKPAESTVGKLLGRWRGKETSSKTDKEHLSKADLSWLESVGTSEGVKEITTKKVDNHDWLDFIDQPIKPSNMSSNAPLGRSNSDRSRISSTSKGTFGSIKTPALAPPPASNTKASRGASPFSFRGPGTSMSASLSASRLASTVRSTNTNDTFGDFLDEGAAPNDGYRDDVADNDAALLQERPVQPRKTSGFLRGLQGQNRGSRYDYNEDDVDSHDDSWTAFRDSSHTTPYQDNERSKAASPPIMSSAANVVRSKSGTSSMTTSSPRPNSSILPPPPSGPSPSWNRNAPLLPPPGRPLSTDQAKQISPTLPPAALPSIKPKTLSQGKTLTNDDLSFFENL